MQLTLWSHFKGGPWDGRFVAIPSDRNVWFVPKPMPPVLLFNPFPQPTERPWLQSYEYVRVGTDFILRRVNY